MDKKILIVYAKAGAGHMKAAEALEAVFSQIPGVTVKNIDLLEYSSRPIKFLYGRAYIGIVKKAPAIYAFGYKYFGAVKTLFKPHPWLDKLNFKKFFRLVDEFNPNIIVSTHFTPPAILAGRRKKKTYKLVVTLTDYEYHPAWLAENVDLYTVSTEKMRARLISNGIRADKISITGIAVNPKFSRPKDAAALKSKYGLRPGMATVLISAGSFGVTPLADVISGLRGISGEFEVMVVCGRNEKLKKELEAMEKSEPRLKQVFGFVDFMDDLLAVSNLYITKPGGIAVSEALAAGVPMILIEPIPGQEEANADYVSESGAGFRARDPQSLLKKLKELIADPGLLLAAKRNAISISKPQAASQIAQEVVKL